MDSKVFESGARSSEEALRYDLVPRNFLRRLAARFTLGAKKHGDTNYRKGLRDRAYITDRINHLQEHFQAYLRPESDAERTDDNLAAIAFGVAFLMEVEADAVGQVILEQMRGISEPSHPLRLSSIR